MDELYKQLISFLSTAYNDITSSTLNVIIKLTEAGFGFDLTNNQFFKQLMKILSRLTHSSLTLINVVFKLLAKIFVQKLPQMTHIEYEILFFGLKEYISVSEDIHGPLELLLILLQIKFIKPQIYDIIPKTLDIVFDTNEENTQELSLAVLSTFIKNFPIDKSLFLNLFTDVVKNIENESPFVRRSLCKLAIEFLDGYSVEFYEEMSLIFVLQIATARVNETNDDLKIEFEKVFQKITRSVVKGDKESEGGIYSTEEANTFINTAVTLLANSQFKIAHSGLVMINGLIDIEEEGTQKKLLKLDFIDLVNGKFDELKGEICKFKDLIAKKKEQKATADEVTDFVRELEQKNDFIKLLVQLYTKTLSTEELKISVFIKNIEPLFNHPIPVVVYKLIKTLEIVITDYRYLLTESKKSIGKILVFFINIIKKQNFDLENTNYIDIFVSYIKLCINKFPEYAELSYTALNKVSKVTTVD